jgi:hypothetical protein
VLDRLLQMAAHRTRTVAFVAVAVLAGAVGGAWAVAGAPTPGITITTVSDDSGDPGSTEDATEPEKAEKAEKAEKSDKAAKPPKPDKAEKPEKSEDAGSGVHGACVSEVARSDAVGGKNDNHGGAVSEAAHSCPRGGAETEEPATP